MPRTTSRPLSLALLATALAACTGSVDPTTQLDASTSNVDADGQVVRDGQANGSDGGRNDGGTMNDAAPVPDLDAQAGNDGEVAAGDASTGSDGGTTMQPSGEPVFVAFGAGFWTATSCDRGRSWRLDEVSSAREDHGEWSAFGRMAFGKGTFVGATGWGAPGHVLSSDSGLAFGSQLNLTAGTSGVGYTGTEFVLITGDQIRRSSDGKSWGQGSFWNVLPGTNQIRYFRSFPELSVAIASIETQMNNPDRAPGLWTVYSTDGLKSWKEATGTFSACAKDMQQGGDIVAAGNTMYMGNNTGALCRSTDAGRSWQTAGAVPGGSLSDLWSDGQSFYAFASKTVYRLEGSTWQPHGTVDAAKAVGATSGNLTVLATGTKFFWSENLNTWTQGTTSVIKGSPLTNPDVRDMVVGHYPKACP